MVALDALLGALQLEQVAPGCFRADSVRVGHSVVFGGQLLAQAVVAGALGHEGKTVKTVSTVFARGASPEEPLDVHVQELQRGRGFASSAVTISQGGSVCTSSLVLLSADEPDFIRHAAPPSALPAPPSSEATGEWEHVLLADIDDPSAVGPAELDVWTRFAGAPSDPVTGQALLAFATDFFLIGTAMRPHPGVGQSQAHVTVTTGVISHTLTFHEPFSAADWLLLRHSSPYAGRGRSYGRADVFRTDGQLVASFVQDSLIRSRAGAPT
ncbi:MAG: acyl-CoA thioesterase [Mycobacteriales bacterium]